MKRWLGHIQRIVINATAKRSELIQVKRMKKSNNNKFKKNKKKKKKLLVAKMTYQLAKSIILDRIK